MSNTAAHLSCTDHPYRLDCHSYNSFIQPPIAGPEPSISILSETDTALIHHSLKGKTALPYMRILKEKAAGHARRFVID